MHCRRISGLLSAFLDAELGEEEMWDVRAHLDRCATCRRELEDLRETKRLLATLALKTPRAELEKLLIERAQGAPPLFSAETIAQALRRFASTPVRPRTMAATIALSLTGMWLASTRVESPTEGVGAELAEAPPSLLRTPVGDVLGAGVGDNVILVGAPPAGALPPSLLSASASRLDGLAVERGAISLANWPGIGRYRYRSVIHNAGWRGSVVVAPASFQGSLVSR